MMSRNQNQKEQKQWLMITEDSNLEKSDENKKTEFCKLRHPKSDEGAIFLFANDRVSEVIQFQENFRSWFIGETIQSDGGIYITTPVDPVFLALPYLINSAKGGKFMTLEQIVTDDDFPECERLCHCAKERALANVAEVKGDDDLRVYRYHRENAVKWLKHKVERLADCLDKRNVAVTGSAHAGVFIKSMKSQGLREDYIRYAHGLISDYLPVKLSEELKDEMGIKAPAHEKPEIEEPPAKKKKLSIEGKEGPIEDYSKENRSAEKKVEKKQSTAQTKLNKVDKSGMKSIASFFGKPKNK